MYGRSLRAWSTIFLPSWADHLLAFGRVAAIGLSSAVNVNNILFPEAESDSEYN